MERPSQQPMKDKRTDKEETGKMEVVKNIVCMIG